MNIKKILYPTFSVVFWLSMLGFTEISASSDKIEEYGIVAVPENKCLLAAQAVNSKIARNLVRLENLTNNWHVSLYHGAFRAGDLDKLKADIISSHPKSFKLHFTNFYTTDDRWIDWGVKDSPMLQNLHESIVKIASPYHLRPLERFQDIYPTLDLVRKKQVDNYGSSGLFRLYKPHLTLFYTYPQSGQIEQIPDLIKDKEYEDMICFAEKIAIGRIGYNGNLTEIVYEIPLKQ